MSKTAQDVYGILATMLVATILAWVASEMLSSPAPVVLESAPVQYHGQNPIRWPIVERSI